MDVKESEKENTEIVVKRTWEDLAEKSHFLLKVSVRELLMGGLHEVLTRVEEVLHDAKKKTKKNPQTRAVAY